MNTNKAEGFYKLKKYLKKNGAGRLPSHGK